MLKYLNIRKELFWDVDPTLLDETKNRRLIIQRVLSLGTLSEFNQILNQYELSEIKEAIRQTGYLDPKTLEFVVGYFGLKREDLKCYTKKQSQKKRWL